MQGTINGYGERVGNCDLTTIMPTLQLKLGIPLGIDLTGLCELSAFVDELANVPRNIRAPYVGGAAFTHKGGLQHARYCEALLRTQPKRSAFSISTAASATAATATMRSHEIAVIGAV